ncbi:MAG: DNA polymerase III subunit [Candidatus Nealsonbacteria bacterium]|nr:DNA polymerase III subunit [Candidatus Nealsonbacteria bacterium]
MIFHQKQWQFFRKTAELGKMPHALLFYGQSSTNKNSLALEIVKLLNCEKENFNDRPCQTCRACRDIKKNIHPDLFIITPQENKEIVISQIRGLQSSLFLKAYSAPYKAVIINQAHFLNQDAQSAFLKLLEEPKGKTIFILITEYPEMLLPTIISRVEKFRIYDTSIKKQSSPRQKKLVSELVNIAKQDLFLRFKYAKTLAEEPQELKEVLDVWLGYFRELLLESINDKPVIYPMIKLKKILKTLQTTDFLLSTTSVNPRLALEILMLEL